MPTAPKKLCGLSRKQVNVRCKECNQEVIRGPSHSTYNVEQIAIGVAPEALLQKHLSRSIFGFLRWLARYRKDNGDKDSIDIVSESLLTSHIVMASMVKCTFGYPRGNRYLLVHD